GQTFLEHFAKCQSSLPTHSQTMKSLHCGWMLYLAVLQRVSGEDDPYNGTQTTFKLTATSVWEHFYDPSGPYHDYGNNWDISWEIAPKSPDCRVLVQFHYLRLESGFDMVSV